MSVETTAIKKKKKNETLCNLGTKNTAHKLEVKEDTLPPSVLDVLCVAENIHPHHQMGRIF